MTREELIEVLVEKTMSQLRRTQDKVYHKMDIYGAGPAQLGGVKHKRAYRNTINMTSSRLKSRHDRKVSRAGVSHPSDIYAKRHFDMVRKAIHKHNKKRTGLPF